MKGPEKVFGSFLYYTARMLILMGAKVWLRFRAYGAENVPRKGGCIIAANHASYLDPPVVGCGVGHRVVRFLARDTLFRSPLARWFFRAVRTVPIDRTKGDVGAIRKALEVLQAGEVLGLFPEGTRSPDGKLREAKAGIGFLIAKAKVPVVPAFIEGTFQALPKGATRIRRAPVTIRYGRPILPAELEQFGTGRDAYERISRLVMSRIAELQNTKHS